MRWAVFFFQAEDGIRDIGVTGVQTCALPICTREGLKEMRRRLDALERDTPPFETPPRTNEPAHWVTPRVVVEVTFSEWTAAGRLRQPIYLGTRDDKDARDVGPEATSMQRSEIGRASCRERV